MRRNKKKLIGILGILFTILSLGIMFFSFLIRGSLEQFITGEIKAYGFFFIFVVSALLEIIPQYIAPHFILLNISLLGFSTTETILLVALGSAAGAGFGFVLGERYGLRLAHSLFTDKRIAQVDRTINTHGKWIVALAAISPVPYIPLIFGSLGMQRKNFFIYGMIPRALSILIFGFYVV